MRRYSRLVFAMVTLVAAPAAAQAPASERRVFVGVNAGYQSGHQTFEDWQTLELYGETGRVDERYKVRRAGPLFDLGGTVRVWRQLEVGIGFARSASDQSANVEASVPHPLFYGRPRTTTTTATGLRHTEDAVSVLVAWRFPVTERIDIAVLGGPSVFSVSQMTVTRVQVSEVGPPFDQAEISSVATATRQKTTVGARVGFDATLMVTGEIGAGLFVRYAGASAKMTLENEPVSLKAGGFQGGLGVRLRF